MINQLIKSSRLTSGRGEGMDWGWDSRFLVQDGGAHDLCVEEGMVRSRGMSRVRCTGEWRPSGVV
jgi:hypothetical protein